MCLHAVYRNIELLVICLVWPLKYLLQKSYIRWWYFTSLFYSSSLHFFMKWDWFRKSCICDFNISFPRCFNNMISFHLRTHIFWIKKDVLNYEIRFYNHNISSLTWEKILSKWKHPNWNKWLMWQNRLTFCWSVSIREMASWWKCRKFVHN